MELIQPEPPEILAFTGHRPSKLGGYDENNPVARWVRASLRGEIVAKRPTKIISGFALGVDQWAAEIALQERIPLIAAIPFIGQELTWPERSRSRYYALLAQAAEIHVVCSGGYGSRKLHARNRWMVDHCTMLIAVWDGSSGGTSNCIRYAHSKRPAMRVVLIRPKSFRAED